MFSQVSKVFDKLYHPHIGYKKTGIAVFEVVSSELEAKDLFDTPNIRKDELLPTLDQIKSNMAEIQLS